MNYFEQLLGTFVSAIPLAIQAVIILIVAYIVASIAKKLVVKAVEKFKLADKIGKLGVKSDSANGTAEFLGKLVYVIVFLLFLPSVFDKLGISNISTPILGMISSFFGYIPNLLAAGIILFIGFFVAKLVRELLVPVFKKLKVDTIQEKAGIQASESTSLSSILAYVVYVIILIPIIVAALQALSIDAISTPAINMLSSVFSFLPLIFTGLAIVAVGVFIANLIAKLLLSILSGLGVDGFIEKYLTANDGKVISFSKIISESVKYIILVLFVVEAMNVLQLDVLTMVGGAIIAYLPFVISGTIIIGLAIFLAGWVQTLILKNSPDSKILALLAKVVILFVAVVMTLSQLGIAPTVVNAAFIIILGALGVAFAVAFGIGGRDFAKNVMSKLENYLNK